MGEIPSRWKGICQGGEKFNSSHCNRLILFFYFFIFHIELSFLIKLLSYEQNQYIILTLLFDKKTQNWLLNCNIILAVKENVPQLSQRPINLCTLNSVLNDGFYCEISMFESRVCLATKKY